MLEMIKDWRRIVDAASAGKRLDLFLSGESGEPRAMCRRAIEAKMVDVNGRLGEKGTKVAEGDDVFVREMAQSSDPWIVADGGMPLEVVYEDDGLVGVDKPAGVSVQPLEPGATGTLMNAVVARYPETATVGDDPSMGGALHRIDTGTSGLVLVARNAELYSQMRDLFAKRLVRKVYMALVEGDVAKPGAFECDLVHAPYLSYCKMVMARDGDKGRRMHARTEWAPVSRKDGRTLLRVTIHTGVTHQIRAQLALAGYPIVGDAIYGHGSRHSSSHCLHAESVEFPDPRTGRPLLVTAPLDSRF